VVIAISRISWFGPPALIGRGIPAGTWRWTRALAGTGCLFVVGYGRPLATNVLGVLAAGAGFGRRPRLLRRRGGAVSLPRVRLVRLALASVSRWAVAARVGRFLA
jgi:hypothetical protein